MKALYSLWKNIASFDFFNWLVRAKANGATGVVFDTSRVRTAKWSETEVRRRLETILWPGVALSGLTPSIGNEGGDFGHPSMKDIVDWCRAGRTFERLKSVRPAGSARYTVTLRNTPRRPERNSNDAAWRAFAAEIGAAVIEDYDRKPLDLWQRVALYAGAEMNFGVTNGPVHLITLTAYPVMMFVTPLAEGSMSNCGIRHGEQYPWVGPDQRLVWAPDELSEIRRAFEAWQEEKRCRQASSVTA